MRSKTEQDRWDAMSDETRADVERIAEYEKLQTQGTDLEPEHESYPMGGMFNLIDEGRRYVD